MTQMNKKNIFPTDNDSDNEDESGTINVFSHQLNKGKNIPLTNGYFGKDSDSDWH